MRGVSIAKILGLLDRLAPESPDDSPEHRRRGRAVVAASLVGCAILGATAATTHLLGFDTRFAPLNLGWALAILVLLALARRLRSFPLLANSLVAVGFTHTLVLASLSGGRNVGALFGFAVFPLLAVLLAGWRSGLVFTGLAAAAVLLSPLLPFDVLAPSVGDPQTVNAALVRDALNVILAVGIVSALYDAARGATLREAETSRVRAEAAVGRQRQLVNLSRMLHRAEGDRFEAVLTEAMEQTARLAGANRTALQLLDRDGFGERFSWGDEPRGRTPLLGDFPRASRTFPWTARSIARGEITRASRLEDLPDEAAEERSFLQQRGTVSWLCVPICAAKRTIGYQSFETLTEKEWDDELVAGLQLLTEILASTVVRHRSEVALRESEEKFALAFRDHPDAMIIMDLETDEILECNEQWLSEAAVETREQVLGRRPWDFQFEFPEDQLALIKQVLRTQGRLPAVEVPIKGRGGEPRAYLISASRIDLGGRECAVANVHDLTTRKELEQQLLHAQKMEAVGRLAGGIAHDYNNMLTVISGYSAGLIESLEGDLLEDAKEIHEAARRSAELTRQLLAFSRRQVLQTQLLDVNELLSGLETMLRPLIGEAITLRFQLDPAVGRVRSDRGQLEQAVVNLVVNARDAMPDGGSLRVETRPIELPAEEGGAPSYLEPGPYLVIRVEDDGLGMDAELVDHAMEPFYTTKPEGQGTGLGLPMVHGLARQCGGGVSLETAPGQGTRVEIYLPVSDPVDRIRPALSAPRLVRDELEPRCILLAEDEERVRSLAARALRAAGHEVIEVEDGEQARERAAALGDELDLLVSDVVMPKMSGTALVEALREDRPDLPVVLMSGYPDAPEGSPIPDDVLFLLKPFGPSRLNEAVAQVLGSKPANASTREEE